MKIFKVFLYVIFFVFLLVSCQSPKPVINEVVITEIPLEPSFTNTLTTSPIPTQTSTSSPIPTNTLLPLTKTPEPPLTPNCIPEGIEAVNITTEDGLDLAGFLHTPKTSGTEPFAVVLAHEYYSTHHSWEWLANKLADEGITALTFDSRGHGKSSGPKVYETAGIDTKAAIDFLNQQGFDQVVCLGTSMGGSGCLIAALEMEVTGIAMLSSPMDIGRLRLLKQQDLQSLTIPKILMIAEEDRVGPNFVADFIEMTEIIAEPKDIYIYPGDEHAAEMFYFESGDDVQEILFDFVTGFSQSAENQSPTNTRFVPSLTAMECTSVGLPANACTGVSSNDEWGPIIREFDGIPMVLVPAGCFTMGSSDEQINYYLTLLDRRGLYADEQPAHQICFEQPFWIDLNEVTNGYYGSYGVFKENNQPREFLTWPESNVFCQDRDARLPTEAEWEYAARGPDNLIYPWGNIFDPRRVNYCDTNCSAPGADSGYNDGFRGTAPVGSFPEGASWVGAQDMAGNVWERVISILLPYPYDPEDGREATIEQDKISLRGVRGGGYLDPSYGVRSANRNERENTNYSGIYGFRCARSFDSNPGEVYTGQNSPTLTYEPPIDAQLGDNWTRPADGSVMLFVPEGTFQMGTGLVGRTNAGQYEFPEHPVKLDSFWIDEFHVTNKQFAEFLYINGNQIEGGVPWLEMESEFCLIEDRIGTPMPKLGFENHPAIDVSWYGAQAYCEWVDGRLPTEAEWEYAASGPENWIYPWGNEYDCTKGNFLDWTDENEPIIFTWRGERGCDGIDHTSPVDAFPEGASWIGAFDMAGNVWDWTLDWGFSFYPTGLQINPTGPETGSEKIVRGGSWNNQETGVRTTMRGTYPPITQSYYIGFRCAYPVIP
jgi:formylglycine-generating enzyme required for sulfatase activity/dienelactone hydrolase